MIYPLAGFLIGAITGALSAFRRGGKPADIAQWGVAFGLLFGLIGLFILVFIERSYV